MRKLTAQILVLIAFVLFAFVPKNSHAQCNTCTFGGTKYPSNTLTPTLCWQWQTGVNGGTYAEFNVQSGRTYFFSYCNENNASANFDTRIVLYIGTTLIDCNSDYGCTPSTAARLDWTSNYNGVVRVRTLRYISAANQCAASGTGAVLAYKEQCPTIGATTWVSPGTLTGPGPTITNPINLQWTSSGTTHHVELWNAVSGAPITLPPSADCINGFSYLLPTLPSGQYKWSVHRNQPCGCCDGPSTTERYFQIGTSCTSVNISSNPSNQTTSVGGSAIFSVSVTGSTPITYQWQVSTNGGATYSNLTNVGNTTWTSAGISSTLTVSSVTAGMDNNRYRCAVSNGCPSNTNSSGAILTVTTSCQNVNITSQPSNQTATVGGSAIFSVSVTGSTPITYQWQVSTNGGATYSTLTNGGSTTWTSAGANSTLTVNNVTAGMNNNRYRCAVSNGCPSSTNSSGAILTVTTTCQNVNITSQPSNQTATVGGAANFSITVTGTTPITYQWQVSTNGGATYSNLTNAGNTTWTSAGANSTLTVSNVTAGMNNNRYRCAVSNGCPSNTNSSGAILTVTTSCQSLNVLTQPGNQTATVGGPANFSVLISGTIPITYQWQVSTNGGATYSNLTNGGNTTWTSAGSTSTLTVSNVTAGMNNNRYRCAVSNGCPSNTNSSGAILTVTIPNNLTIDYSSNATVAPPWQRQNDDYDGKVTVIRTGNVNAPWHLEIDVHNSSGTIVENTIQYPSIPTSVQFFNTANDVSLRNYSVEGKIMAYYAVLDNSVPLIRRKVSGTIVNVNNGLTYIIKKMWDKENIVFNNSNNSIDEIKIPIKYYSNYNMSNIFVSFSRINSTSSAWSNVIFLNNSTSVFYINNDGYIHIKRSNSNIKNVTAGDFTYKVIRSVFGLNTTIETGDFEVAKFGSINNNSVPNGNVLVFIGGWNNTIEDNIMDPNNTGSDGSDKPFSIAKSNRWSGYNTWYIAQPNTNYTQLNAYCLGLALDSIKKLTTNYNDVRIICHSKGGLEVRALLSGLALSYKDFPANYSNWHRPGSAPFNGYPNSNSLNITKVCFLSTPHDGAILSAVNTLIGLEGTSTASPALKELGKRPGYQIIDHLNNPVFSKVPTGIQFGNVTAYQNTIVNEQINNPYISGTVPYYSFAFEDGVVAGGSSDIISNHSSVSPQKLLKNSSNNTVNVIQMYQHNDHVANAVNPSNPHTQIHRNYALTTITPLVYSIVNQTSNSNKNLDKIVSFINDNSPVVQTCPRPNVNDVHIVVIKSILSGAKLYVKIKNDSLYYLMGITDENGRFNGTVIPDLSYWDSIKIEANGVETLQLPVTSEFISSKKINTAMFKSSIPSPKIQYPKLSLPNQVNVTNQNTIQIKATAANVSSFQINQHSSDTSFINLALTNNLKTIVLDTGYNKIIVRFIGVDTVAMVKEVYYFPDTIMQNYGKDLNINATNNFLGAKLFIHNIFYRDINFTNINTKILEGENHIKFSKYGYRDTIFIIDTPGIINLKMQSYSYSSLTDSIIFNFNNKLNPQYWKTITIKSLSATTNKQVSAMQYDDAFTGMSLKPQTRKFVFRKLGSAAPASFKIAIALDQINTPDKDSVYLLYKNGKNWVKYPANQTGISEYDPEVQKIAFDKLYIDDNETHEIVLMKKQAPIMKAFDTIWHSGQTIAFPLNIFVRDPDSIKNDLGIFSNDVKVSVVGNIVYITAPVNFIGTTTYSLSGTHDFLDVSKTYIMKVIPPEVYIPNAFTPNRDGLNDVLKPIFLGKLISCHFTIFNRNGQKIFETTDCTSGWNGRIKGVVQDPGTYVWMLSYQFEGEGRKETKGTFVLLR